MRCFVALVLALALGVTGCSETSGPGGSGGVGGTGGNGVECVANVCPCTEAGIRAAIDEGGGPFSFDCKGRTTVVTEAEIVVYNDVELDGGGNLIVDGGEDHRVFAIRRGTVAGFRGFTVTRGLVTAQAGGGAGFWNVGTLTLSNCTVSENSADVGGGILNASDQEETTIINSTISRNSAYAGGGIANTGTLTMTNSTVSGNSAEAVGGGIFNWGDFFVGALTMVNSTIADNNAEVGDGIYDIGTATLTGTLVRNDCAPSRVISLGHNIESPGDTCGFDRLADQANVTADDLKLEPLRANGGPTETHALGEGSVAIDVIFEAQCVDAAGAPLTTDQRGIERPQGSACDVGAVEMEVTR